MNRLTHSLIARVIFILPFGLGLPGVAQDSLPATASAMAESFAAIDNCEIEFSMQQSRQSKLVNRPIEQSRSIRMLKSGERWAFHSADQSQKKQPDKRFLYKEEEAVQFAVEETEENNPTVRGWLLSQQASGVRTDFDQFWPTDGGVEPIIFGVISGRSFYGRELKYAEQPQLNGNNVVQVRGESSVGEFKFICDPTMGYLPTRIELKQRPKHFHHRKLISNIKMNGGNVWPAGGISEIDWVIDCQLAKQGVISRTPYVASWNSTCKMKCADDVVVTSVVTCRVEQIRFDVNPKPSDYLLGLDVEKDLPLQVNDALHLSYKWDGEWAVPSTGKLVEDTVTPSGKPWLIIVGVVAVAAIFFAVSAYFIKRT